MAPEILRYEKYDAKADLWSVGAVLYETCVGKPPFRAQNHVELLKRIEHARSNVKFPDEDPSSPTTDPATGKEIKPVPADIKALIRSLLKRHPVERASYEDFFASPAIANSKTRHGKTGRTSSSRTESIASTAVSTNAPPTPTTSPGPAAAQRQALVLQTVTEPTPSSGKGKGRAVEEPNDPPETPISPLTPAANPIPVPAWVKGLPANHKIIPPEVLDPKALFPPSRFDFRGRTQKGHTDLGADVSADRAETPSSSPATEGLLQRMAPGPSSLSRTVTARNSPRSRVSPHLAPKALPEPTKQIPNEADEKLLTSMGETTRDYVFVDARAVEFNKAIDGGQSQADTGQRLMHTRVDIQVRQTSPPMPSPNGRTPTTYPPEFASRRTSMHSLPPDAQDAPVTFPPPGQYGYAQSKQGSFSFLNKPDFDPGLYSISCRNV